MKFLFLLLLLIITISACTTGQEAAPVFAPPADTAPEDALPEDNSPKETSPADSTQDVCFSDAECVPAGCSSQLCVSTNIAPNIMTTCEYKEEYTCLQQTSCGCVSNECQWLETQEYTECLDKL